MAKKIITIGKKGVTERIQGSGPVNVVNLNYPNGALPANAGVPIEDRPQPPSINKNGGPFNAFRAFFADYNTGSNIVELSDIVSVGDFIDVILFTPDTPTLIEAESQYTTPIWTGTTEIISGGAWFVKDSGELQGGEISSDSPIEQISGELSFGEIGHYRTTNGVDCYGYRARSIVSNFGYLDSSGGTARNPAFFYYKVFAGSGPCLGASHISITNNKTGQVAIILEESKLTQDMLDNPRQTFYYFSEDFPVSAFICGIYAIRP